MKTVSNFSVDRRSVGIMMEVKAFKQTKEKREALKLTKTITK